MRLATLFPALLLTLGSIHANEIAESQQKWVEAYKKQKNIPAPADMLVNTDAEPDLGEGFASVYNGKDLTGWTPRGGECKFEAKGEAIVGTCVPGSPSTYLSTDKSDYADFVFTAELKWAVDGNTGIMFRAATKPGKKEGTETVFGPQAEMEAFSKERYWSGGIYGQSAGGWIYPMWLDAHEKTRGAMKKDGWNRITIKAVGDTVKTWLNGVPAAHWKTDEYKQGFFSLQIHSGKGGEVHFRNIKVKELGEAKAAAAVRPKAEKPNFIFVLSDDIAQGDIGCYGQKLIKTPRLDQMAAEGTRYMQGYCGTTVCAPSRSVFFTGLHSGHCPVRGNCEIPPEGQLPLPDKTVTIAEVAKSAGYATSTFGKWGMGFFDTSGAPSKQGVDHFYGYNCQRHAHSYFPTYLFDDDKPFLLPGNNGRDTGETYAQELIQKDMIKWLRTNGKNPFMMFYAITLPHGRHEIDDFGIYADKPWTKKQKAYAAQVTRVDSDMGELMDTLRELGVAENTLIVFSGDNGSSFAPNSEIGKRFDQASNGLRGFKRGMYEGALRQGALAWWPGTVPAGRVDEQPWAFWDLMPTFAELSGAELPAGYETDGLSLVDYLKGGDAPERDYFYWELHVGNGAVRAARWDDWKAVVSKPGKPIEIYDLAKDPGETKNLAKAKPKLVAKAEEIFKDAHRPDPNWPLDRREPEAAELAKKAWEIKRKRDRDGWVPPSAAKTAG